MPKIKLIKIHDGSYYDDISVSQSDLSGWEEVSQIDLDFLQSPQGYALLTKQRVRVVILEDVTSKETIMEYIKDIKNFIQKEKKQQEERQKKYAENESKRKAAAEKKKLEKAKKLLEKSGMKIIEK